MKIMAIIPARSGSKSVKDKNIRLLAEKPMLAYSIEHALESKYIDRVIVSTDSEKYANIASQFGAEIPFLRPEKLSTDLTLDIEVFIHALNYLKENDKYVPDIVVQLRPTFPIRNVKDIDSMIEIILNDQEIDSVRSVVPAKEIPYKMWTQDSNGKISPLLNSIPECYNMPRQALPKVYYQNASIDVIRASIITEKKSMSGDNIYGYVMEENFDIDTEEDFLRADNYLKFKNSNNIFCFDIDGVIALFKDNLDYSMAEPNYKMINIVNQLYDNGNKIILFTARGYVTKIDWEEETRKQMIQWGVRYTELKFGKPAADFYIDDHTLTIDDLYNFSK